MHGESDGRYSDSGGDGAMDEVVANQGQANRAMLIGYRVPEFSYSAKMERQTHRSSMFL